MFHCIGKARSRTPATIVNVCEELRMALPSEVLASREFFIWIVEWIARLHDHPVSQPLGEPSPRRGITPTDAAKVSAGNLPGRNSQAHPIMRHFPETWRTPRGELYEIAKVWPTATPLAHAYGEDTQKHHVTIWVNQFGKARVFGTTIGHHNETMEAEEYLDLVTRGLLWSVEKLGYDGEPRPGYGAHDEGCVRIFDGESLEGWKASENRESFQVEDGKIVVDGPRSHLFYEGPVAQANFKNFEFKASGSLTTSRFATSTLSSRSMEKPFSNTRKALKISGAAAG